MAIEPREFWQKPSVNYNEEDTYEPRYVQEFYIDNLIKRVLAHLFAEDESSGNPVRLKATASGLLKVSAVPPVRDTYEAYKISVAPETIATITFSEPVILVEIWTYGAEMVIEKSTDGSVFGDQVRIPAGSYWSFESTTKAIRVTNTDLFNSQDIQVVGWR